MNDGWIKLWRKIEDNPVLHDAVRYSLFVRLLARAARKPCQVWFQNRLIDLARGDVLVSERDMAKLLNCDRQKIRTAFRVLKSTQMLTQQLTQGVTHISICNYERYQTIGELSNPAANPATNPALTQSQPTEQEEEEGGEERKKRISPAPNGADDSDQLRYRFSDWWACWDIPGTKKDRSASERKYRSVLKARAATHDELCVGVKRYMAACRKDLREVRYIKAPDVWLNKGCWADEHAVGAASERSKRRASPDDLYSIQEPRQ